MKKGKWIYMSLLSVLILVVGFVGTKSINSLLNKSTGSTEVKIEIVQNHDQVATFAGGCFWCMEPPFEKLDGVKEVISGYTGGSVKNPSYDEVSSGITGHVEAVQIIYDPHKVSYKQLLDIFWRQIDPTDEGGQFVDRGEQYKSAIFYHSEEQRKEAIQSRKELEQSGRFDKPIVTEIKEAQVFYKAEEYHQDYYQKNTLQYKWYRYHSGRDQFLDKVWGEERTTTNKSNQ